MTEENFAWRCETCGQTGRATSKKLAETAKDMHILLVHFKNPKEKK